MRLPSSLFSSHYVRPIRFQLATKKDISFPIKRSFLTSSSQTISASKVLPYSRTELYSVIADISSYPTFLPYCKNAKILEWSRLDRSQRRWPARAELKVGWGAIEEQYVSRVYCIPEQTVEALAGEAKTNLPSGQIRELYEGINYDTNGEAQSRDGHLFRSLRSTWSLRDEGTRSGQLTTRVDLKIDFDFQSPIYAAMAGAAIPQIADSVMDAFQARAKTVIEQKSGAR